MNETKTCFTNRMYIVKTFRRQVCLFDLVLSLSSFVVFYTEHLAYLLDCIACYETMAGKNLAMC